MCLLSSLKWGSNGYSLGIVQWDFTRRDHPRNPGRVSGSSLVNKRIFHFLFLLCNREAHFESCPILPSPPLNTKHNVDRPCTHDIPPNTKHNVDLYHALTPMSCDVCLAYANVMHHCMLHHATCIMNGTWTT